MMESVSGNQLENEHFDIVPVKIPSLNILIKLMSMVSTVVVGVTLLFKKDSKTLQT